MPLPEFTQVRYARAPLRLVVCQVHFPGLLRIAEPTFVANFQEVIVTDYPELQREQQINIQLSASGAAETSQAMLYRFSDRERIWSVILGEGSLTLEARAYFGVEDLLARFEQVMNAARETLGIQTRNRLGLRYVNEFRHPERTLLADWQEEFRPEFLGFAASVFDDPVGYTLQQIQVQRPDGQFAVRHGVLRGTTVPPFPSSPMMDPASQGAFYLLDLDYSDPRSMALDIAASRQQLRAYNDFSYRFFRWTLTERHHVALEPRDVRSE
jgi:uncharacterized protein (TIGR04255 family)